MALKSLHKSDDKSKQFSENLKMLMEKHHVIQKDLASHLGVQKSAVSNYLAGTSVPRYATLLKISDYFGVSINKMLTTLNEPPIDLQDAPCVAPLFIDRISNSPGVIYRQENLYGNITFPFTPYGNANCYAVKIKKGEVLKMANIFANDIVFFEKFSEVESGQIAAVHFKEENKIHICRVSFEKNKTIIERDKETKAYTKRELEKSIVILGKVLKVMAFKDVNEIK